MDFDYEWRFKIFVKITAENIYLTARNYINDLNTSNISYRIAEKTDNFETKTYK
jgi:hypothetical protein